MDVRKQQLVDHLQTLTVQEKFDQACANIRQTAELIDQAEVELARTPSWRWMKQAKLQQRLISLMGKERAFQTIARAYSVILADRDRYQ